MYNIALKILSSLIEHTFKMLHTSHGQCDKEANEAIKLLHSE